MPHATTHRVLFIDAYDSFTNNIIALLETSLGVEVTTIKIDEPIPDFEEYLKPFSAVIAGPGPGDPRNSKDVGWIRELWKLEGQNLLPVLGICLGFQSLVLAFGGTVKRLREPRHGIVRRIRGKGEGIFSEVKEVETVQYHSFCASLGPEAKYKGNRSYDAGTPSPKRSDLRSLAWDYEMDNAADRTDEALSINPPRIMMAVEHKSKPFFGIQFHAESICSNNNARKVIESWWDVAKKWRRSCGDSLSSTIWSRSIHAHFEAVQNHTSNQVRLLEYRSAADDSETPFKSANDIRKGAKQSPNSEEDLKGYNRVSRFQGHGHGKCNIRVITNVIDIRETTVASICDTLSLTDGESVILDSEMHQRLEVGEHSIIGIVFPDSLRFEHSIGANEVRQIQNGQCETVSLRHCEGGIFSYLKSFMSRFRVENSNTRIPFWGGLMGFISYEACLETIGIKRSPCSNAKESQTPDLNFIFVERSIIIDHFQQKIHVQTIKPDDKDWVNETVFRLKSTKPTALLSATPSPLLSLNARMSVPGATSYKSKIRACQSEIRAGNSYELCLTNQATIRTQNRLATWPLYLRLRSLNPAPFSAYLRLGRLTLLSSSPERFLMWSRPSRSSNFNVNDGFKHDEKTITCQFRPIKGTVKRQPDPSLPALTLAEATTLLTTSKERAENLMIVDLIRHDLHGVVGSGRVSVPRLMVVEEYATLFQLVSVVEGSLAIKDCDDLDISKAKNVDDSFENTPDYPKKKKAMHTTEAAKTGIDILAASLPPGSMTGAPKLRSCQILHSIENKRPRGIYSGVVGYMDVGGGGDFSVVIRSAVRWDHDPASKTEANGESRVVEGAVGANGDGDEEAMGDEWTIGAGGAVTSLSTEEGEWEEMIAKLKSTLRLFEDDESGGGKE
ncbi:MAG: hypothetical protein ALECFALPRED_006113 [Alectoria fallacina]|uniref:aminodeoxychorismate synthase n=1 Tax=Alectoria fallacina TaxID=1903189 RepID=A0A8H3I0A3_9LECA|nr:MAG: hypothetical protein ALECFALPRED_006113 [Alectoria fallacina]